MACLRQITAHSRTDRIGRCAPQRHPVFHGRAWTNMDAAGGGGRVVLSVLSIMRGLILALGFCFSFVHPAVAGGPVAKMLGFFDRLRQAGTEQAAHRPVPHVETRFTEGEVNDYMVYALKTTPRPGVKSIHVEFTDGNYMATTVVADLDALERWKPGTIPGALRWALSGTKSLRVDLRFRQTTDRLVGLSVEKAYYQDRKSVG